MGHEKCTGGLRQDKTRGIPSFLELNPQHWVDRSASSLPSIFVSVSASQSLLTALLFWQLALALSSCRPSRSPAIWWDQSHEPCFLTAVSRVAAPSAPITSRNTQHTYAERLRNKPLEALLDWREWREDTPPVISLDGSSNKIQRHVQVLPILQD